ncbi:MAG: ATP-binding cassette domain-containing protein [Polyangiaceae bacterium]
MRHLDLGESGLAKSVVVVATSDAPALERLRAAEVATAYAEWFRDRGSKVMLLVDSVTRYARAQREIGLAAGEPPARRGYPPSVFSKLPRLLERTGQGEPRLDHRDYTVLVEGGDMDEPVADEVRGVLDGHVVLDRRLAARGHFPAVDVGQSLSRVMPVVTTEAHRSAAAAVRASMALHDAKRDLVALGGYAKGADPELDLALERMPKIDAFLRQSASRSAVRTSPAWLDPRNRPPGRGARRDDPPGRGPDLRLRWGHPLRSARSPSRPAIGSRSSPRNGAGKSTLLRSSPTNSSLIGSAVVKRDVTVGYHRQSHEVDAHGDVLSAFLSGFGDVVALRDALAEAQENAASGTPEALTRLAEVTDRYHLARGDELEREVAILASKLGFSDADLARPVASLSGGERGRLTLGVVLAQEPDLLLLDEPTNHLDLDTITWLEGHLATLRSGVLIVSHDRAFLDNVSNRTLELGTRGMRDYPVSYSEYTELRRDDLARERALLERQEAMIAKTEDFIRKNIAGQKTKQAQSRRKMLDKLERVDRPEDVWAVAERVAFRFAPADRSGDIVLETRGLRAERGGRTLFDGAELLIRRGERIGIVGPNGAGKSTLLKLVAGRGLASDVGHVRRGTNLQEGYFDQHLGELDPKLTAVDEVRRIRGDFTTEVARQYLARFRFWGDDPLRVVGGFSGGERSRLALAKLLLEPRNLLFLDEPTNHLDIPAAEILEEALVGFDGTVLFVSHDRRFLETVATRIVHVHDGKVDVYPGGFRDFDADAKAAARAKKAANEGARAGGLRSEARPGGDSKRPSAKSPEDKRKVFEAEKQKSRAAEQRKRRAADLEASIREKERELEELRGRLKEDPGGDWAKLATMAAEEQTLTKKVDAMLMEWAKISEDSP